MIKSMNAKLFKRCLTTKTVPPQGYRNPTDDDLLWLKDDNMKSRNFLYSQNTLKRDYFIQNRTFYHWTKNVKGVVYFGNTCEGQPGFVHGGAAAAILDEVLGFTCFSNKLLFIQSKLYNVNKRDIYLKASIFQEEQQRNKLVEAHSIWKILKK